MYDGDEEIGISKNPALQDRGLARPELVFDEGETSLNRCEHTRA